MKTYLFTTGVIFGLLTLLHVWRAIDDWSRSTIGPGLLLEMAALVALPGVFCVWAFWLLRTMPDDRSKRGNDGK